MNGQTSISTGFTPKIKLKLLLQSRKFWAAVIGLVVVILDVCSVNIKLDQEQLVSFILVIVSYIIGTALDKG